MEQFTNNKIYCRKLGHEVTFAYCRQEQTDIPCRLIRDCWGGSIPIDDWLAGNFSPQALERLGRPTPSKTATLVDLINKARDSQQSK